MEIVVREYSQVLAVGTPCPDGRLCHGLLRLTVGAEAPGREGYALASHAPEEWIG